MELRAAGRTQPARAARRALTIIAPMSRRTRILLALIAVYAIGMAALLYQLLADLDPRYRESAEEGLIETAQLMATVIEQEVEHGDCAEKRPRPAELALPRLCERRIMGPRWPGEGGVLGSPEASSSGSADGAPDSRRKIAPRRRWGPAMEVRCFGVLRRMRCHGRLLDSPRTCASGPAAEGRPALG